MTRFPNDSLDAALCHGDLLLQICANTQDTVIHRPARYHQAYAGLTQRALEAGRVYL
ncbi:Deferrochelatase/peroxidase EfeB precursor [Kluyvera cryocrescens]|uniref:Deferrochelatase/peroxidase EfeB n=1 Tax=Kluyvera cryocrescens TaxID=580 RepID=A0A485CDG7_KLUCR|nr:Deferrochelatase/peroxidase EfeB precursor [Kluyvera cryocrescens]